MDALDIYGDLDEFHEQEEKKSKELLDLEAKYGKSLKTIEAMKMEKKDLRKKIRILEQNLQNLLDTAKSEAKRKDKIIEDLRKEKDDFCFRRQRVPEKSKNKLPATDNRLTSIGEQYINVISSSNKKTNPQAACDNTITDLAKSSKQTSKKLATDEKEGNQKDSKEKHKETLRSKATYKNVEQKSDNEIVVEKREPRYRDRHRDIYKDNSKLPRRENRAKSRERSLSPRYEDKKRYNREKDKDKIEKHYTDDHSSYKKHKNERRDRSKSSDRYSNSDRSHRNATTPTKNYKKNEEQSLRTKREKERKHDRKNKSYSREDDDISRAGDKSTDRKRRRSLSSEEQRHKKRTHLSTKMKDIKSEHKTVPSSTDLHLESVDSSDDDFDIKDYKFLKLEDNMSSNRTKNVTADETEKCSVKNVDFGEEVDISIEAESKKDSYKSQHESKNCAILQETKTQKLATDFEENNSNKQNEAVNTQVVLHVINEKSTSGVNFESSSTGTDFEVQVTKLTESNEAQNLTGTEENVIAEDTKEAFKSQQDIEEDTKLKESHDTLINKNQKSYSSSPNCTIKEGNKEHHISMELKNGSDSKTIQNIEDVVENTKNSPQNECLNSLQNNKSSQKTEKIKANERNLQTASTVHQESAENGDTLEKLSLLDALFGRPLPSTNVSTGDVQGNVKDILNKSNDSSHTTSSDLYTDINQTVNSSKNGSVSPHKKEKINNDEAPIPNLDCSALPTTYLNGKEEKTDSNSEVENYKAQSSETHTKHETLKMNRENCGIPKLVSTNKLNKEENITMQLKGSSPAAKENSSMGEKNISSENLLAKPFTNTEKIRESNTNLGLNLNCIGNVNPDVDEREARGLMQKQTSDTEAQGDKLIVKTTQHELQTACLDNVFADKATNMMPNVPKNVNENKVLFVEKTHPSSNTSTTVKDYTEKSTYTNQNSIDQDVIKEINEECLRLKSASKEQLNRIEVPKITKEESIDSEKAIEKPSAKSKQIEESSEVLVENLVLESDEDIEIVSLPEKSTVENKAKISNPTVIEIDNENENLFFNLTLSSDDDEDSETLSELQKKCRQQQKHKIEIIENIRLPTLFRSTKCTEEEQPPKQQIEIIEAIDISQNNVETNPSIMEDEIVINEKQLKVGKAASEAFKMICATENKLEKRKIESVTSKTERSTAKELESNEKIESPTHRKASQVKSNSISPPSSNAAVVVIDITEDCPVEENIEENKNNDMTKEGATKVVDDISLTTTNKAQQDVPLRKTPQPEEQAMHETDTAAIQAADNVTKDQFILGLSADREPSIESCNKKINNEVELEKYVKPIVNHNTPKPKTGKRSKTSAQKSSIQKTLTSKSLIQKPKSFIKLDVMSSNKDKERRRLTEHNGKIHEDSKKQKQQDSLNVLLSENIQEAITACKKDTTNQSLLSESVINTPTGPRQFLTKEFSIRCARISNKIPIKAKVSTEEVEKSPSKSIKAPVKRKRSTSGSSSPIITNLIKESTMDTEKTKNLSTCAEVRAMLIDGKSPNIANDNQIPSPISTTQDTNVDELEKDMQAIFESPGKFDLSLPANNSVPCGFSTVLDTTIDETVNSSNLESENLNKTNESSFESKHLSLGTTQYVYERVSENVVNLFITRRRNKKRPKLDGAAQ